MSALAWELSGSGSVVHVFDGDERSERWGLGVSPGSLPDESEPFDLAETFDAELVAPARGPHSPARCP